MQPFTIQKLKELVERNKALIIISFFATFLFLGIAIHKDYGVSTDEQFSRMNGLVSFTHIIKNIHPDFYEAHLQNVDPLHQYKDKDYGVFFELPAVILEFAFGLQDDQPVYFMRHLLTFLVFFISVIFFYQICLKRFEDWKIALLGSLMLIISPRIFGQAFYNSKDIVFMSLIIVSIYTMIRFLDNKTIKNGIWHGLASAAAIDVRIMGIIIPALTIAVIFYDLLKEEDFKARLKGYTVATGVYSISTILLVIIFWPYLWESPAGNFIAAFENMSKFRWYGSYPFMGEIVDSNSLPWYYIPVWIVISTPIPYTLLFLIGSFFILKQLVIRNIAIYKNSKEKEDFTFFIIFLMPLLAIIVLGSVLYDAWRQVYFIYPAMLLVALIGLKKVINLANQSAKSVSKQIILTVTVLSIIPTVFFMVRNHPYQDVYFSFLPKETIEGGFERDYYGLSYREGLEYILSEDKSQQVNINCSNSLSEYLVKLNSMLLPIEDRKRINVSCNPDEAKWVITNFRWTKEPYDFNKEVYTVTVDEVKILSVFKLK